MPLLNDDNLGRKKKKKKTNHEQNKHKKLSKYIILSSGIEPTWKDLIHRQETNNRIEWSAKLMLGGGDSIEKARFGRQSPLKIVHASGECNLFEIIAHTKGLGPGNYLAYHEPRNSFDWNCRWRYVCGQDMIERGYMHWTEQWHMDSQLYALQFDVAFYCRKTRLPFSAKLRLNPSTLSSAQRIPGCKSHSVSPQPTFNRLRQSQLGWTVCGHSHFIQSMCIRLVLLVYIHEWHERCHR